jgi:hypothetical protein
MFAWVRAGKLIHDNITTKKNRDEKQGNAGQSMSDLQTQIACGLSIQEQYQRHTTTKTNEFGERIANCNEPARRKMLAKAPRPLQPHQSHPALLQSVAQPLLFTNTTTEIHNMPFAADDSAHNTAACP